MDTNHKVLYLDFDGVLHHENVLWHPKKGAWLSAPKEFKLFQHAELLEDLVKDFDELKIVLSTAWVKRYGFEKCARKLPQKLQKKCVGATFHSHMDLMQFEGASRGMQVWSDVVRRKPSDWLAVDDDAFNWPKWCLDNLVHTHPILGISDETVLQQLKSKLDVMKNK